MDERFKNRQAKVAIVEPVGTKRQVFADIIKSLGFSNINGFKSVRELVVYMETEPVDWIIMPLMAAENINALQILKIITENHNLSATRVSLLLEPLEQWCLKAAFNMGLFSFHPNANVKETLVNEFKGLLTNLEKNYWDTSLSAAVYFRKHLLTIGDTASLVALEEALLKLYPGDSSVLFQLGQAQFYNKQTEFGLRTLQQVALMDPSLAAEAEAFRRKVLMDPQLNLELDEKLLKELQNNDGPPGNVNVFGVDSIVVVDGDSTVLFFIEKILKEAGVPNVQCFDRTQTAIHWLKKNAEPQLIIQEWRLPDLPGPFLLQQIRQMGHINVPVIVLSSLIKPQEMPLLREMSAAGVVPKPFDHQALYGSLVWILQQERMPTEQRVMERKIKQFLEKGRFGEAEQLKRAYLALPGISTASCRLIEAEVAYRYGQYQSVVSYAAEALKAGGDSLVLLDLLGKAFLKLGNYPSALKAFEKAQALSPLNVGRLCLAALAEAEVGGSVKAQEWLQKAKNLDKSADVVMETDCSLALLAGDLDKTRELMEGLASLSKILGYMNNRAVAMARSGKGRLGMVTYRDILAALPQKHSSMRGIVTYNLALALVRDKKLADAAVCLEQIGKVESASLDKKINSLRKRVERAIKKGIPLELNQAEISIHNGMSSTSQRMKSVAEAMAALEIPKGTICCLRLLGNGDGKDPRVGKLLENMPRFKVRETIEKPDLALNNKAG